MPSPQPSPAQSHPAADLTGSTIGRYSVRALLGSGGQGEVYCADDLSLHRTVALKRLSPALRSDERYRQRFLREAQRASGLNDPHIAGIYDVLEHQGELLLVMEYVEGVSLRQRLREPVDLADVLKFGCQCCEALIAAHQSGVVHRDIKPENIMLTPTGRVKVLDFGVAKRLPAEGEGEALDSTETKAGEISGTPAYMAPELLLGRPSDERADIFSLGVVFYELLTGRHPFLVQGLVATVDRILHQQPRAITQQNPTVPPAWERVVCKMLAKDPAQRYASAQELLTDLTTLPTVAAPVRPAVIRWLARHRTAVIRALALATLLAAVGTGVGIWIRNAQSANEESTRDWVLIADFSNSTGNRVFDHTLNTALAAYLEQSGRVKIFPEEKLRRTVSRLGERPETRVDEHLATRVALSERIPFVISGGIAGIGKHYLISLQLSDPYQQSNIRSLTSEAVDIDNVLPQLNDLAAQLRKEVGESATKIQQSRSIEQITSSSIEAIHSYSVARREHLKGNFAEAVALYREAVRQDPAFALAYARLSGAYKNLGNDKAAGEALNQAMRRIDRVSEPERYIISGFYHMDREEFRQAIENLLTLIALYPDSASGYSHLSICYLLTMDLESGEKAARKALELDPSLVTRNNLAAILIRRNKFSEAVALLEQAHGENPESSELARLLGVAYGLDGKTQRAFQIVQNLMGGNARAQTHGEGLRIQLLLLDWQWHKAVALLHEAIAHLPPEFGFEYEYSDRLTLSQLYFLQGNRQLALYELKKAEKISGLSPQQRAVLAAYYAWLHEPEGAARQEIKLRREGAVDNARQQAYLKLARAAQQLAGGNAAAAREALQAVTPEWDSALVHMLLANAELETHHWKETLRELEEIASRKGEAYTEGHLAVRYLRLDYYRGQAYQGVSDVSNARFAYERFVRDLSKDSAQPDSPLVLDARRRLKELSQQKH